MSADAKGISCGFFRPLAFFHAETKWCVATFGKVAYAQVGRNFNRIFYLTTKVIENRGNGCNNWVVTCAGKMFCIRQGRR